jgi:hypothetical protein
MLLSFYPRLDVLLPLGSTASSAARLNPAATQPSRPAAPLAMNSGVNWFDAPFCAALNSPRRNSHDQRARSKRRNVAFHSAGNGRNGSSAVVAQNTAILPGNGASHDKRGNIHDLQCRLYDTEAPAFSQLDKIVKEPNGSATPSARFSHGVRRKWRICFARSRRVVRERVMRQVLPGPR